MKTKELSETAVKAAVRERYGQIAEQGGSCGCATSCCSADAFTSADTAASAVGYAGEETSAAPAGSNLGLGCGNPQAIAALKPGEDVLDLGSGAGFDAFLAARAVGESGSVIGVDMTPEMVARAEGSRSRAGYANVEFRIGEIENLPVTDESVDVVISNCVINLSPDKPRAFREAYRTLRPGGRLAVADIVALAPLPEDLRGDRELLTGCVAGAAPAEDVRAMLAEAGFADITIVPRDGSEKAVRGWTPGLRVEDYVAAAIIKATKPGPMA